MNITFLNDPKLNILLPVIYLAWQDDILTKEEYAALTDFINSQDNFSKAEKDFLKSKIDLNNPPGRSELFFWKDLINKALNNHKPENLTELGFFIANADRPTYSKEDIEVIEPQLSKLEQALGIISNEAISSLCETHDTITNKLKTVESFSKEKMTALLDGDQAEIINRVKKVISRPEFAFETSTDITVYREKVLEWSKILAKEGFGSHAYPKQYGGAGDIEGYFTIMETLSYHDLSLVIKFGVQFGLWGMSVMFLGTEKHFEKYLKDIGTLDIPGGFAMKETHNGSNVKGLETTATYNHKYRSFTIHTPTPFASKEYI